MAVRKSKVFRAFEGTESLRTTVPQVVVGMLGLRPGSELVWTVHPGSVSAKVKMRSLNSETKQSRRKAEVANPELRLPK